MSAVAWVAVMAWAADDRGYFEPSDVGAAAFLYAAVGGVGVAGFAALIAPPGAARPPLAGVLVATAVTALLVGASAMLVVEDVGPEDAALVAALSLVLVFAGSVAAVVTRAIRREPSPADPSG
jgi:hypothetical protein